MTVNRVFAIALLTMATAAVIKFSLSAFSSYREYSDVAVERALAEVRTAAIDATVAMSLERSVVQVALALEDPIPDAFRNIVDAQRAKGADGIEHATGRLDGLSELATRDEFLAQLNTQMGHIDGLRREFDAQLALPLAERDAERIYELPFDLKDRISELKNTIELLRSDVVVGSAVAGVFERIQSRAWEGREYGGRARTYFAIATLNEEPLKAIDQPVVRLDRQRADGAWDVLSKAASTIDAPAALQDAMGAVQTRYYDRYIPTIDAIAAVSATTQAGATADYSISFNEFFDVSNEGLAAFETLSSTAGDVLRAYWSEREAGAFQDLLISAALVLATMAVAVGTLAFIRARVTRKLEQMATALTEVAHGRLDVTMETTDRELQEIGRMADALVVFREKAAIQLAVTAAVQSNRTPMLLLDQNCDVITRNDALDELWTTVADKVGDLTRPSGRQPAAGASELALNFEPLMRSVDKLAELGERVRSKRNCDLSFDLWHNGLVLEVKRSPITDGRGETVGVAVEIADVTAVRQLEADVIDVIASVENGEFDKRVSDIDGLGFTSIAAKGLNNLMDAIGRFMTELDASLTALAEGDMTRPIDGDFYGEFKAAADRFNGSVRSLRNTLDGVGRAVDRVRNEADSIAKGSRDLASRAESQASTLQATASTVEEMSDATKENSGKAARAVELSNRTSDLAADGGEVVRETVDAMDRIEQSSSQIGEIISVIEGIAFQTNLLALNAAVEAARAGDAGKGFAVVASEVRGLAQRSSEAARDIKGLIETSATHVTEGVALVNRTGESLTEIVGEIRSVAETISEISSSVREQASSIGAINNSFGSLDEMTQNNTTLAEASASAANGLFNAASELGRMVGQFKTGDETAEDAADMAFAASETQETPRETAGLATGGARF